MLLESGGNFTLAQMLAVRRKCWVKNAGQTMGKRISIEL